MDAALDFIRVLSNEHRLRIAGLLLDSECSLSELADLLDLKPNEVLNHLAELAARNLVSARLRLGQTVYRFNKDALYTLSRAALAHENITPVDDVADPHTRRVLRNYFRGERLTQIPNAGDKFMVLIRWLVTQFAEGQRYTEKEVNAIITRFHEDYATLRRGMIDAGLMQRENGVYWRSA